MEEKKLQKALEAWQQLQPLSEEDRARLSRRFTVDFNYNSNHIEGNTLTYGQTEILLLFGKVMGDVQFITEKDENVWWYDGERIAFRSPNYSKVLRILQIEGNVSLSYLQEEIGINRSALQKLLASMVNKGHIARADNGSWRVFITPSA